MFGVCSCSLWPKFNISQGSPVDILFKNKNMERERERERQSQHWLGIKKKKTFWLFMPERERERERESYIPRPWKDNYSWNTGYFSGHACLALVHGHFIEKSNFCRHLLIGKLQALHRAMTMVRICVYVCVSTYVCIGHSTGRR